LRLERILLLSGAVAVAAAPAAPPGGAQSSLTCDYAVAAWAMTQIELAEARANLRACRRERRTACTAQQGQLTAIEQRVVLLRNYIEGYCSR
jgi:hypothetical protein